MKYKKGLILICLIICLFSIASVCASEVNETILNKNTIGSEESQDVINEHVNLKFSSIEQDNDLGLKSSESDYIENNVNNNYDKIRHNYGEDVLDKNIPNTTYSYLDNLISHSSYVTLYNNIVYTEDYDYMYDNGIPIKNDVIINGNGYAIGGTSSVGAFILDSEEYGKHNVTLINLTIGACRTGAITVYGMELHIINCTFKHNYESDCSDIEGGSPNFSMIGTKFTYENPNNYNNRNIIKLGTKNCLIENCDFYNNMLRSSEGAILLSGNNISIKNCNFKNYGQSKQALVVSGSNISVFNCNFISNNGGGVCFSGVEFGTIKNCYFTKNRGYSIIFERYSKNCKLINCTFENNSKPLISWNCAFGEIISCKFLENASYSEIFNGDKTYCKLINSTGYGTPTNISIDRTNFHYKDKIIIHFRNLNDGRIVYASKLIIDIGNYHYEIDTPNIMTVSDPDYVSLDISNIKEEGKYNATIYFTGNNQYDSTSLHELLTIKIKRATKIGISNEIVSYKPTIELVGTLYGRQIGFESYRIVSEKNLTISCNNKIYNVYNNGKLFIDLSPGTYEVITSFDGDDIFESCRAVSIIKVLPSILLENLKTEYDEQVNFTTQFLNEDGDNLKYQYVLYNLDGEDNIIVTNENGLVNFNERLTSGVHTLKIVNPVTKEELIKTISVKTSIIPSTPINPVSPVKPVTKTTLTLKTVKVKKSAKKLVLQATLKQGNKALSGKKIIFKFNGRKYTAKTNKKGVAKITIKKKVLKKLKVGKKVKYQATYFKDTVKKTAKVKK